MQTEIPDISINMDQGQMQEVFINLVLNSAQAIGDRAGSIWISANPSTELKTVDIIIKDTGAGIPDEHLSRIFDPFFTTKETSSGTGLGLSIAYGIVKQHFGVITAENIDGGGACFTITMPFLTEI